MNSYFFLVNQSLKQKESQLLKRLKYFKYGKFDLFYLFELSSSTRRDDKLNKLVLDISLFIEIYLLIEYYLEKENMKGIKKSLAYAKFGKNKNKENHVQSNSVDDFQSNNIIDNIMSQCQVDQHNYINKLIEKQQKQTKKINPNVFNDTAAEQTQDNVVIDPKKSAMIKNLHSIYDKKKSNKFINIQNEKTEKSYLRNIKQSTEKVFQQKAQFLCDIDEYLQQLNQNQKERQQFYQNNVSSNPKYHNQSESSQSFQLRQTIAFSKLKNRKKQNQQSVDYIDLIYNLKQEHQQMRKKLEKYEKYIKLNLKEINLKNQQINSLKIQLFEESKQKRMYKDVFEKRKFNQYQSNHLKMQNQKPKIKRKKERFSKARHSQCNIKQLLSGSLKNDY